MAVEITDGMQDFGEYAKISLAVTDGAGRRVCASEGPAGGLCVSVEVHEDISVRTLSGRLRRAFMLAAGKGFRDAALPLSGSDTAGIKAEMIYRAAIHAHDAVYDALSGEITLYLCTGGAEGFFAPSRRISALLGKSDRKGGKPEEEYHDLIACDRMPRVSAEAENGDMPPVPEPRHAKKRNAAYRVRTEILPKKLPVCFEKSTAGPSGDRDEYSEYLAEIGIKKTPDPLGETFSDMLLRLIQEKGMDEAECYKRANIDRRLFSKIRCDRNYQPKKDTVISFAVALGLSLDETHDFLHRAGYTLSPAIERDRIVETFISSGAYNIYDLNMALYLRGYGTLGERRQAVT